MNSPRPDISLADAQQREDDSLAAYYQAPQDTWVPGPQGLLVEANKPDATLAVIDGFGIGLDGQVEHGEITSALAMQASGTGESNLLRVDNGGVIYNPPPGTNFGDGLDQFIESRYAGVTHSTTVALQEIHDSYPQVNTISQSQGTSGPRLTGELAQNAQDNPAFALRLAQDLGHPGPLDFSNPLPQRLIAERVQDTLAASPQVAAELAALKEELADHPEVAFFNSAGNDGPTQDILRQAGFQFDPTWNGNPQSNSPQTQSIAAGRPNGLGSEATGYTQRTVNSVAFDGMAQVNVDGQPLCYSLTPRPAPQLPECTPQWGTSYAAPLAAGTYNSDPAAYQRLLMQALPPLPGQDILGVGFLH